MAQKRPIELINNLSGDFQRRDEPQFALSNFAPVLTSLPGLHGAWSHVTIGADHLWISYTPTSITFLGNTTDPTTYTLTSQYVRIGDTVKINLLLNITNRGSGDRTRVQIALPTGLPAVVNAAAISAFDNLPGGGATNSQLSYVSAGSNLIDVTWSGAMAINGYMRCFAEYQTRV